MITFSCPGCGQRLNIKEEFAGKRGTCPHCKQALIVPAAAPVGAAASAAVPKGGGTGLASGPAGAGAAKPRAASSSAPTPASAAPANENCEFLAPPQGSGEIGRLGPYRVLKELGAGGMGVVFQAEDPHLKRVVALKAMRPALAATPSARQRFLREAQTTASIKHDHIVTIHQVGEDRGVPFLAMEFLEGEALDERVKREGKLPIREVVRIGREMAEGLSAAHERGLIHRDIKPGNIWLETPRSSASQGGTRGGGRVKILDFGLARAGTEDVHLTKTGAIVGTPAYMAPEQAKGETVDARCDLFSLGCVLYLLSTGRLPFKGNDTMSTLMALATETPRTPEEISPEVPPALSQLIVKLLEKNPKDRPQSARAVADTLGIIQGSVPAGGYGGQGAGLAGSFFRGTFRFLALLGRVAFDPRGRWLKIAAALCLILALVAYSLVRKNLNRPPEREKSFDNSIGMKMMLIPTGKFLMGSLPGEKERDYHEGPEHEVVITRPFYMSAHEVTVGQFRAFVQAANYRTDAESDGQGLYYPTGPRPLQGQGQIYPEIGWDRDQKRNWKNPGYDQTDQYPVIGVTWKDANKFLEWLSNQPDKKGLKHVYRLPTEAEWEYACRAETSGPCHYGESLIPAQANFFGAYPYPHDKAQPGDSRNQPVEVGSFEPNKFGLYDMHGNVAEWCSDFYDDASYRFYRFSARFDPKGPERGPEEGGNRVHRGGHFYSVGKQCRSAARSHGNPNDRNLVIGFRAVCEP